MGRAARIKKQQRQAELRTRWREFIGTEFLRAVRAHILASGAQSDSCICSTKVVIQLAEQFNLRAEPLVVEASVFNPVFADHFQQHGIGVDEDTMRRLGESGGRFVVLGCRADREPAGPNKWPGHLVAVVHPPAGLANATPHIIDLSIDQAHRPNKSIVVEEPIAFPTPDQDFLQGKSVSIGYVKTSAGLLCFLYRAYPEDHSYDVSPDWQRSYVAGPESGQP